MIERIHTSDVEPDADEVAIAGHVHEIRDLGGLVFLIVRDREGLIQIVFKEEREPELFEAVQDAGAEDVVRVVGKPLESDQAPGGVEIAPPPNTKSSTRPTPRSRSRSRRTSRSTSRPGSTTVRSTSGSRRRSRCSRFARS